VRIILSSGKNAKESKQKKKSRNGFGLQLEHNNAITGGGILTNCEHNPRPAMTGVN